MQSNAPPFNLTTLGYALLLLATPVASLVTAFIGYLFGKRRQSAEIHKTNAETNKTEAETRQIDSAILMKAYERLDDYEEIMRRQNHDIIELEQKLYESEFDGRIKDGRIKAMQAELDIQNLQVHKARAQGFLADREPGSPNPAA